MDVGQLDLIGASARRRRRMTATAAKSQRRARPAGAPRATFTSMDAPPW